MMRSINELEDEVHHLPHPDTDQEWDVQVLEEDDEDEEEGIYEINVFDHIGVLVEDFVMPVEFFGSRRQGRADKSFGQNW